VLVAENPDDPRTPVAYQVILCSCSKYTDVVNILISYSEYTVLGNILTFQNPDDPRTLLPTRLSSVASPRERNF